MSKSKNQPYNSDWNVVKSEKWEVNGIQVGYAQSLFDTFAVRAAGNDRDSVRLHFGIRGDYKFNYKQLNKSFDLIGGHHNIMYSKGLDLRIENKSPVIETFGVEFPRNVFIQFTNNGSELLQIFNEKIQRGEQALLSRKWGTINLTIQKIIDEIIANPYKGKLKSIFLLAKILELLVLCIDNYEKTNANSPLYVKNKLDLERIIAARDFINTRITNPPSLSEVAHHVGLNEFKLKHGFKELFNSTIFGYLTGRRLHLAKQYLRDTDKTASQIADELGYSSPQHFHHQFKKTFGVTPKDSRNHTF